MYNLFTLLLAGLISTTTMAQVNLSNGLVAYYPFNATFQDMSGTGNNGTANGGTGFGTDHMGNINAAAHFDGINDWISVAGSQSLTARKHLSIAFRFKTEDSTYQQDLITKSDYSGTSAPDNFQYYIGFNSPVLPEQGIFWGTSHSNTCVTGSFLPAEYCMTTPLIHENQWYCVVVTFDSSIQRIFIDGVLAEQDTVAGTYATAIDSCMAGALKMGVWWQNDPTHFKGSLDEVRIYDRELNNMEIDSLCNLNSQSTTGMKSLAGYSIISIAPNPTSNDVEIQVPGDWDTYILEVYNQLGQQVYAKQSSANKYTVPSNQLPGGLYFVKIFYQGQVFTDKFLKQ